jgi:hypothetical protein
LQALTSSALSGNEWSALRLGRFISGERILDTATTEVIKNISVGLMLVSCISGNESDFCSVDDWLEYQRRHLLLYHQPFN